MVLQLLKMGCDSQQQPASLQRGRMKTAVAYLKLSRVVQETLKKRRQKL